MVVLGWGTRVRVLERVILWIARERFGELTEELHIIRLDREKE